jgi:hypothetical protein
MPLYSIHNPMYPFFEKKGYFEDNIDPGKYIHGF